MSTIVISNIKATGETASRAVSGVAAAWVNFDHSTNTVRDSFNESSVSDDGPGLATITLTNSMSDANFVFSNSRNGGTSNSNFFITEITSRTASSVSLSSKFGSGSSNPTISMGDAFINCVALFGDLA